MRKRLLSLGLIMVLCFSLTGCKSSDYKKAVELQNSGDYAGALELFKGCLLYTSDAADEV